MQEMLMHVATLLPRFDLLHESGEPGNFTEGFTLRSATPIQLKLRIRR
jgi:hypothetical protein